MIPQPYNLKSAIPKYLNLSQSLTENREEGRALTNSFYEAGITLIQTQTNIIRIENYRPISFS